MGSMPEKPPVVLLANVRWEALREWSHILATLFSDAGYPTVFVETTGIRKPPLRMTTGRRVLKRLLSVRSGGKKPASLSPNLTVYSPLVAPPTHRSGVSIATFSYRESSGTCGGSSVLRRL